ncbi:acyl-CoA dehydrogenase family protein [Streptomyces sp. 8N616]|uniref:acyl-CoA dehydrogenase family protein n=1 Tax=Streptomyces sp. 8N616 TaxID=3457414 RepID=UPI003FD1BAFB
MRFLLDEGQRDFDRALDRMLGSVDAPGAARAWATGDPAAGRALWRRLSEAGVFALAVPEAYDGVGPLPVELAVAFVQLGRHAVPGPAVETVAAAVLLGRLAEAGGAAGGAAGSADAVGVAKDWLPRIASGDAVATLSVPGRSESSGGAGGSGRPGGSGGSGGCRGGSGCPSGFDDFGGFGSGPYALDADSADAAFAATGEELRLSAGHGSVQPSFDPVRRLARLRDGGALLATGPAVREAAARAAEWAAFATAAQALGTGLALVERTVAYAKQRTQFGTAIGSFQAVKHQLADALMGLEFARPLLYGAAVALAASTGGEGTGGVGRGGVGTGGVGAEVAAAKAAAGEAAYAAARTALQLHGAIGYTAEYDLSLWIRKARALRAAWGTPSECRTRVLAG